MLNNINELKQNKLLEVFCELVQIPSPSLAEDNVISWIENFCKTNGISCTLDDFKNVHIKVEATNSQKQSVLMSSHMDVVGDASPINLQFEGDLIQTDKTRTLGADDKVGVACALYLAFRFHYRLACFLQNISAIFYLALFHNLRLYLVSAVEHCVCVESFSGANTLIARVFEYFSSRCAKSNIITPFALSFLDS